MRTEVEEKFKSNALFDKRGRLGHLLTMLLNSPMQS